MSALTMTSAEGMARVESLPNGRFLISVAARPGYFLARQTWETAYPLELIREIHSTKGVFLCDEIMRDEDPRYVEHYLRHEVLGYADPADFAGKRVLDFGCGSGASTMVLGRMLPPSEIVGVELEEKLLRIAQLRARHFGQHRVRFLQSPAGDCLPAQLGLFDYVMFSAVYEHLLPHERKAVLPLLWRQLKPGGILFLNQTPHRYAPLEIHTTGLPLINYLPDVLALHMARRFSKRVSPHADWETLLREGIRGATVREIMGLIASAGRGTLLEPKAKVGDRIDLWYGQLSRRQAWLKSSIRTTLKALKALTGIVIMPSLALAIRKDA